MLGIVIPDVQPMRNRFAVQARRELHVLIQTNIPIRRTEHKFHLPVSAQKPVVGQIGDEIRRIVEVAVVIVVTIQKLMDVECAAHADTVSYDVRMLQREINAMVPAEAAARHTQLRCLILPAEKRQEFVQQVALVLQMAHDPHSRMHALVVPAFGIDAIGAEHLELSPLDLGGKGADHAAVLVFKELSHGGGKDEEGRPGMPEDESLHVAVQFLAVTFVIFAVHR